MFDEILRRATSGAMIVFVDNLFYASVMPLLSFELRHTMNLAPLKLLHGPPKGLTEGISYDFSYDPDTPSSSHRSSEELLRHCRASCFVVLPSRPCCSRRLNEETVAEAPQLPRKDTLCPFTYRTPASRVAKDCFVQLPAG